VIEGNDALLLTAGEDPGDRAPAPGSLRLIQALVNTLNHDKNVNVRLASLYSLARFADNPAVRDSLVNSLAGQTEPMIQVVLINMLADKKEHRAIGPIRDILSKDKSLKEVREAAEKGLKKI